MIIGVQNVRSDDRIDNATLKNDSTPIKEKQRQLLDMLDQFKGIKFVRTAANIDRTEYQRSYAKGETHIQALLKEAERRNIDKRNDVLREIDWTRTTIILDALLQDENTKVNNSMPAYYEANKEYMVVEERVHVGFIHLKSKEVADNIAIAARHDNRFDPLVFIDNNNGIKNSNSYDKSNFVRREEIKGEFDSAVFSANSNSVVGPIKGRSFGGSDGYYVVWLYEKRSPGIMKFDEFERQSWGVKNNTNPPERHIIPKDDLIFKVLIEKYKE